jgi:MmyB-like transcription regulator ligand binding domain/Helix-turn-helix domain
VAKPGAELAKFLRMKRQLLRPEMLLLDTQQRASADSLLRADVATAVGVPLADYEHLENGADNPPSEQVLRALIEVLDLTDDDAAELGRIIAIMGVGSGATVHPQLMALLDSWELTPAFICDKRLTVLSSNPIARVLSPMFDGGTNVLRATYLDANTYRMIRNPAAVEGVVAAWAKKLTAEDPPDASWTRMISDISRQRPQFRDVWESDVNPAGEGSLLLDHPAAGKLDLYYCRFRIEGCDDQFLVTMQADGIPTQCGLRVLKEFASRHDSSPPW